MTSFFPLVASVSWSSWPIPMMPGFSLCGGTIARLTARGCEVSYLPATRGQRGSNDPTMTPERLAVIREAEQRRAAEVLGVHQVGAFSRLCRLTTTPGSSQGLARSRIGPGFKAG
ncbi:PIG-L deacetylase family protein [Thermogemmatispora onikobensis]|uniref:PIG-L deacetylase family protein n=1 Tax=Thermogemmatispora onikobensis TaxID=732234 RepID=UPI00085345C2|nr:PIG-L family deacetylase [Thermogemmatispora onikobensis]